MPLHFAPTPASSAPAPTAPDHPAQPTTQVQVSSGPVQVLKREPSARRISAAVLASLTEALGLGQVNSGPVSLGQGQVNSGPVSLGQGQVNSGPLTATGGGGQAPLSLGLGIGPPALPGEGNEGEGGVVSPSGLHGTHVLDRHTATGTGTASAPLTPLSLDVSAQSGTAGSGYPGSPQGITASGSAARLLRGLRNSSPRGTGTGTSGSASGSPRGDLFSRLAEASALAAVGSEGGDRATLDLPTAPPLVAVIPTTGPGKPPLPLHPSGSRASREGRAEDETPPESYQRWAAAGGGRSSSSAVAAAEAAAAAFAAGRDVDDDEVDANMYSASAFGGGPGRLAAERGGGGGTAQAQARTTTGSSLASLHASSTSSGSISSSSVLDSLSFRTGLSVRR